MDLFSAGRVTRIEDLKPGDCLAFADADAVAIGIALQSFKHPPEETPEVLVIQRPAGLAMTTMPGRDLHEQQILAFRDARIVLPPDPRCIRSGLPAQHPRGAVFLESGVPAIATFDANQAVIAFNLRSGARTNFDPEHQLWWSRWKIVVPDHARDWATLCDIEL